MSKVTAESISFEQIKTLRSEAAAHSDFDQVAVCDLAINGEIDTDDYTVLSGHMTKTLHEMTREQAYEACASAINDARAQQD